MGASSAANIFDASIVVMMLVSLSPDFEIPAVNVLRLVRTFKMVQPCPAATGETYAWC